MTIPACINRRTLLVVSDKVKRKVVVLDVAIPWKRHKRVRQKVKKQQGLREKRCGMFLTFQIVPYGTHASYLHKCRLEVRCGLSKDSKVIVI